MQSFESSTDYNSSNFDEAYTSCTTIISGYYETKYDFSQEEKEWAKIGWNNPIKIPMPICPVIHKINIRIRNQLLRKKEHYHPY